MENESLWEYIKSLFHIDQDEERREDIRKGHKVIKKGDRLLLIFEGVAIRTIDDKMTGAEINALIKESQENQLYFENL